ncbi:hypothetical protein TWF506_007076 [Arthrobotrys conoides]|uniref:Secreted protein n=1 Tax=Arthrobotrys conoides TaxID=74498 RepID=A0AAN8RWB8_9PEZI
MPSNRPFLAGLFVAFRAHSALQKPSAPVSTASTSVSTGSSAIVSPTRSTLPCSTAAQHGTTTTPQQSPPQSIANTRQHSPTRRRRSSSSSTDGVTNGGTGEKWWIGGRAGDGQARFYQLQPV